MTPAPDLGVSAIVPLPISGADTTATAFFPLAGQSPLLRVVRAMSRAVSGIGSVVVAAAEPMVDDVRETLTADGPSQVIVVAAPMPGRRADCVAVGLESLATQETSPQAVLLCDVRRPLVSPDVCERVIADLRNSDGIVMPTLSVTDSVKVVDERGAVTATLDRSTLQAVQYPRGFPVDQLADLLARRASDDFDDLAEALRAEAPITLVDGDAEAFAVDLPRDAAFVEAVIASRPGSHQS